MLSAFLFLRQYEHILKALRVLDGLEIRHDRSRKKRFDSGKKYGIWLDIKCKTN